MTFAPSVHKQDLTWFRKPRELTEFMDWTVEKIADNYSIDSSDSGRKLK
jgi:hypothetical protein